MKRFSCFSKKRELAQKFPETYYIIKQVDTNMVLSISQNSGAMRQLVIQEYDGSDNQKFQIKENGTDYKIICKKDNLCLTVDSSQNGERVYGSLKYMDETQRFRIEEQEPDSNKYMIFTQFGMVLSVSNVKTADGTMVFQNQRKKSDEVKWSFFGQSQLKIKNHEQETVAQVQK